LTGSNNSANEDKADVFLTRSIPLFVDVKVGNIYEGGFEATLSAVEDPDGGDLKMLFSCEVEFCSCDPTAVSVFDR